MGAPKLVIFLTVLISLGLLVGIYKIHDSPLVRIFGRSLNDTPPKPFRFPKNYHATGKLHLPHSEIEEPFEVWFSRKHNRSRIDYYYGTDKTYQLADLGSYGQTFKVVPMYNDKKGNYIGCWNLAGSKRVPIVVQPIVPNMTTLKFSKYEVYRGTATARWEYRYLSYGLLNTHTLWVTRTHPPRPVRYEMKGYDNLLASYYDYYVLEYISFEEWKPDLKKFELPKDLWCNKLAHSLDSHLLGNPMQEFMSYGTISEKSIDKMYDEYKTRHNKSYDSDEEHVKRKHIFRHNMRYIRSINRKNLTYKLAPNHMVDMMDDEYDRHKGLKPDTSTHHKGAVHLQPHHEAYSNMTDVLKTVDVPDKLDWRDYGAVTPVRGQGICGSCYALAAVGALEGAYFMKTGKLVELSAQQVIDCSWGSGNHGCRGGYYNKALSWIYLHGVATAESYGPYLAQEGTCHFEGTKLGATLDAFAFVPKHNNTALKISVAKFGPAAVSMNESPISLKFYSWGIYDDPACDNRVSQHSALVVGYGQENGIPYWLVKNTWSSSWGMDGYIKIAWKGDTCGITRNPVVALMKHTSFKFPVKEKIKYINPLDPDSMGRKIHPVKRPRGYINPLDPDSMGRKIHPVKRPRGYQDESEKVTPGNGVHKKTNVNQKNSKGKTIIKSLADKNSQVKSNIRIPCSKSSSLQNTDCNVYNKLSSTKNSVSYKNNNVQSSLNQLPRPGHKRMGQQTESDSSDKILQRTTPYLGELQNIYNKLEKLISSSKNWQEDTRH